MVGLMSAPLSVRWWAATKRWKNAPKKLAAKPAKDPGKKTGKALRVDQRQAAEGLSDRGSPPGSPSA